MAFTLIHGFPLRDAILAQYQAKQLVVPDVRTNVTFEDPDGSLEKAVRADPLLLQQMMDAVIPLLQEDLAKLLASAVAATELNIADANRAGRQDLAGTYAKRLSTNLHAVLTQIVPRIEPVAQAILARHAAKRKEYRNYKIKAGVSITLGATGVLASVAGIVLSGGGSSLLSLIGIVRGMSEILQQCKSLYDEAETTALRVHGTILKAMKGQSSNANVNALLEVGRAAVKSLTTIDAVPTPAKAKALNDTFGMKLTGLEVGSHDTAILLNKALAGNEKLSELVDQKGDARLVQKLESAEAKVMTLIGKIHSLRNRVELGSKQHEFYTLLIADMEKGVASWGGPAATIAGLLLNTAIGLGTGAATGAIDGNAIGGLPFGSAAKGLADAATAAQRGVEVGKIVAESIGLTGELINDYQEIASLFGTETEEQVQKAFPNLVPVKKTVWARATPSTRARAGAVAGTGRRAAPTPPPRVAPTPPPRRPPPPPPRGR